MSATPANQRRRRRRPLPYRNRHRNCLCLIVLASLCWLQAVAVAAAAPDRAIRIQLRRRNSVSCNGIEVSLVLIFYCLRLHVTLLITQTLRLSIAELIPSRAE